MRLRRRQRRERTETRGVTLFEVLIVVAILALVSSGVAIAAYVAKNRADVSLTRTSAETIRDGADQFRLYHPDEACPTVSALLSTGMLRRGSPERDVWGTPFEIRCDETEVTVISAGKDRTAGTEDDIRVPPA